MDAEKLMNVLSDLNREQNSKEVTNTLNNLINYISSNQSSLISEANQKLRELLTESIVNKYSPSNLEIMEKIGGLEYYGKFALGRIDAILKENSFNIQKTATDLQKYVQTRTEFSEVVKNTKDNLNKLNIDPYYHNDDTFEIGLLMPKEMTDNKIVNVTKELNKWDKIFKTLKELNDEEIEDTKLDFISNGSLQFFIDNSPSIAACLAIVIERVIKLYRNIIEIRNTRQKLKDLGVTTTEQKNIEKQEKEIFNKEIDKIVTDIVKEFATKKIEDGRLNELKIAMKGHVTYVAKCIDNGMTIEITPPEIQEPEILKSEDTEENKNEKKQVKSSYERTLKNIEVVEKSMEAVKTVGQTGLDIIKLLTDSDNQNTNDE